ncbi:MAG: DUF1579 family protein [Acidobacteria bacterium]|nr:DUF1579 family protein [Acidobacteriota bacterium]
MRSPQLFCLSLLLCSAAAVTQDDMLKPATQLQKYASLVGTWEGSGTVIDAPSAPANEWTAKSTYQWVLGGHFLRQDMSVDFDEQGTLLFRNFYGWDRETQSYMLFETSNMGTAEAIELHWPAEDTMVHTSTGVEGGQLSVKRWISKIRGNTLTFSCQQALGESDFFLHARGEMKQTSKTVSMVKLVDAAFMPEIIIAAEKIKPLSGMIGSYKMKGWMIEPGQPKTDISGIQIVKLLFGGTLIELEMKGDPMPNMPARESWGCIAWDDHKQSYTSFRLSNDGEIVIDECRIVTDNKLIMTTARLHQGQPIAGHSVMELGANGQITKLYAEGILAAGEPQRIFEAVYTKQ